MKKIFFVFAFYFLAFPFPIIADSQLGTVTEAECTASAISGSCISVTALINSVDCPPAKPVMYAKCQSPEIKYCCAPEGKTPISEPVPTFTPPSANASFAYTPLEAIPGQRNSGDFPSYVRALYSFGILSVGIAGLLMVMVGGFYYVTSAGNSSQVEKGKEFIKDALIGIVVAFGSWLVLYIINPDLVNINLDSLRQLKMTAGGRTYGPTAQQSHTATGDPSQCSASNSACSVNALLAAGFTSTQANIMSCIAMTESSGNPGAVSPTNACGTFQVVGTTWRGNAPADCADFWGNCHNISCNTRTALTLVQRRGYSDWTCPGCNPKASSCISKYSQ